MHFVESIKMSLKLFCFHILLQTDSSQSNHGGCHVLQRVIHQYHQFFRHSLHSIPHQLGRSSFLPFDPPPLPLPWFITAFHCSVGSHPFYFCFDLQRLPYLFLCSLSAETYRRFSLRLIPLQVQRATSLLRFSLIRRQTLL